MGIELMPRLLGPDEGKEKGRLCWRVATPGDDDPAQMGQIVAWERPSGEAFVEFWLGDFPDIGMFHEMKDMVVQNIEYRAFSMVEKLTYESILQIQVEVTLQELDECLRELHAARAEQAWSWSSSPTPGKAVRTRLALCPGGVVFQGGQIWYVEALDLSSETELATPFCTIGAGPRPGLDDWRSVICWPDWREVVPAPYPEYLWALTGEFQQRGIIQDRPVWLTEPERVKIPRTARQTTAEPAAGVGQTEALPVKESTSAASASPPAEREATGDSSPGQAHAEPPPPARDSAPESPPTGNLETPTTDIDRLLSDLPTMRQHFKDYSLNTARRIIEAIPKASELYRHEGGQWGPGWIAKVCHVASPTVGRYLRAFRKVGITEIAGIEIPHRYRKNLVNNPRQ